MDCKHLLLFVGVLNERKGEFGLIKAMQEVVSKYHDVKLLIIGDGPTKEVAVKFVKSLKLKNNIILLTFRGSLQVFQIFFKYCEGYNVFNAYKVQFIS
jgi:glycosyltransferase involved in cell wall biosynthesis